MLGPSGARPKHALGLSGPVARSTVNPSPQGLRTASFFFAVVCGNCASEIPLIPGVDTFVSWVCPVCGVSNWSSLGVDAAGNLQPILDILPGVPGVTLP